MPGAGTPLARFLGERASNRMKPGTILMPYWPADVVDDVAVHQPHRAHCFKVVYQLKTGTKAHQSYAAGSASGPLRSAEKPPIVSPSIKAPSTADRTLISCSRSSSVPSSACLSFCN